MKNLFFLLLILSHPSFGSMSTNSMLNIQIDDKEEEPKLFNISSNDQSVTGSTFIKKNQNRPLKERQQKALDYLVAGNVAPFSVAPHPIYIKKKIEDKTHVLTVWVSRDFLALGLDNDFLRFPLSYKHAMFITKKFRAILPTADLVEEIYKQADKKLVAHPLPPIDGKMSSLNYFHQIDKKISADLNNAFPTMLVAGHKKNLVLTKKLLTSPKRVAIYGWYKSDGARIQNLNLQHDDNYLDYSHGIRLVSRQVELDGKKMDIAEILKHPKLSILLTSEGPWDIDILYTPIQ